jgi:4-hydroxymandelate oxidase
LESEALLTGIEAYREQARCALDPVIWDYLEQGAGKGLSTAWASGAWESLALRPRILRGVRTGHVATTALGIPLSLPVMTAPNGRATRYTPEGESAVIAGAAAAGSIALLPSSVAPSLAALRALHPGAELWQQLYMYADRARMRALLDMIRDTGCRAVVLTVDLMPADAPAPPPPPRATWESDPETATGHLFMEAGMDDLAWLCAEAGLPVVVKGVLRGDDALLCLEAGASALIVSNHGGNQLDTAISSADALPEVIHAVAGRAEVYVDGGIRDGVSVLKALALGARAVLIGRPVSYALAAGGGVALGAMLDELRDELIRAMALCGAGSLAELEPSLLRLPGP